MEGGESGVKGWQEGGGAGDEGGRRRGEKEEKGEG